MTFDHVDIRAADHTASVAFYDLVLPVVGLEKTYSDDEFAEWSDYGVVAASAEIPPTQRLHIAFFTPERGSCAVNTIMWKDAGADTPYTSSRVRVTLRPGQMVRFDDARLSMNLLCGADASTLSVVAPPELIMTSEPPSAM